LACYEIIRRALVASNQLFLLMPERALRLNGSSFALPISQERRLKNALRGDKANPFHVHDQNRVIAFHRWLEGNGEDVQRFESAGQTS
jgi:hypothetical protein